MSLVEDGFVDSFNRGRFAALAVARSSAGLSPKSFNIAQRLKMLVQVKSREEQTIWQLDLFPSPSLYDFLRNRSRWAREAPRSLLCRSD